MVFVYADGYHNGHNNTEGHISAVEFLEALEEIPNFIRKLGMVSGRIGSTL